MNIGFNSTEYTVAENEGSVQLTVVVLAGQLQRDVSVQVSTSPATADFGSVSPTLIFSSTITSINVPVNITDDMLVEVSENFFGNITLISTDANVTVNPAEATITIEDDDGMFYRWV